MNLTCNQCKEFIAKKELCGCPLTIRITSNYSHEPIRVSKNTTACGYFSSRPMLIGPNIPVLPQDGDFVMYHGSRCVVVDYDFAADRVTILTKDGNKAIVQRTECDNVKEAA